MSYENLEFLYRQVRDLMREALNNNMPEEYVVRVLDAYDYLLQQEHGFSEDSKFHRLSKIFKFKKEWVGRVFRCKDTGESFKIPMDVKECDFYNVGKGYIDVGRYGFYSRMGGNIEEVL